jgi:hypothetical protein
MWVRNLHFLSKYLGNLKSIFDSIDLKSRIRNYRTQVIAGKYTNQKCNEIWLGVEP